MKPSVLTLAIAPSVAVAVAFALAWDRMPPAEAKASEATFWDPAVVDYVRDRVAAVYVDELPRERTAEMFYAALKAYVGSLDPYSDFLAPDEYRRWSEHHAGHYAGIGVRVNGAPRGLRIVGVLPGGPADQAGLRIGDVVTAVEGAPLAGADPSGDATVARLKGPEGSRVTITVWSPPPEGEAEAAGATREVTVVRDEIHPPTVFARRVGEGGRFAHVRIGEFVDTTDEEFDRHLDRLVGQGVRGVVLDVRGNGGGVMSATVNVADRFLRSGDIVRTVARTLGAGQVHAAKAEGTVPDEIGLVVLVDGYSASASELLAGALQDHRRGVLLGTRTHGKFLVQSVLPLSGKDAALKITTARYTTPLGRWFRRTTRDLKVPEGLIPDVVAELPAADRSRLHAQWENDDDAAWGQAPGNPEVAPDWVDPQLARAIDLLDGETALQEIRSPSRPSDG
jgi:carboxyl-terminal processing protease